MQNCHFFHPVMSYHVRDNPGSGSLAMFAPYETTADLPAGNETKDFEIPANKE